MGTFPKTAPGSIEHFLAERYYLYTADEKGAYSLRNSSSTVALQSAEAELEENTMAATAGIRDRIKAGITTFFETSEVVVGAASAK